MILFITLQIINTFNLVRLIDNRYKEYEKSISKVYSKVDSVIGDVEKSMKGLSNLTELRRELKNKRTESRKDF